MSEFVFNSEIYNRDLLIIAFGGCNKQGKLAGIQPFEFVNTLSKYFPHCDKRFYRDLQMSHYHRGLKDISLNIEDTVTYLEPIVKNYKRTVFIGNSAGGYAAILFGSLLNATSVFAFFPQTKIRFTPNSSEYHRDLIKFINKTTKYHLFGNTKIKAGAHGFHHIDRLKEFPNVRITNNASSVKHLRDSGQLEKILKNFDEPPLKCQSPTCYLYFDNSKIKWLPQSHCCGVCLKTNGNGKHGPCCKGHL
jgi:hypothetical protein